MKGTQTPRPRGEWIAAAIGLGRTYAAASVDAVRQYRRLPGHARSAVGTYKATVATKGRRFSGSLWDRRPAPRSLRHAAVVDRWRRERAPAHRRTGDVVRWARSRVSSGLWPFLWITFFSLIPLLLPIPARWSLSLFWNDDEADSARNFLQTLWQVDAAAIALSLAVVLFAFESEREAKARGSLTSFARRTRITLVLALSIAAIFNIAAVLLGLGSGAPGGWAATWTCVVSAAALASVPYLLQRTLAATGHRQFVERRRQTTRAATQAAADEDIFNRIAALILVDQAKAAKVELRGFFLEEPERGSHYVYAEAEGVIHDIRLRALNRLGGRDSQSRLLVKLGDRVNKATPVMIVADDLTRRQRRAARRIVRISKKETASEVVREEFEWLHEAAVQAIYQGLPKTYDDLTEEYVEALAALPASWKRIGEDFNTGAASSTDLVRDMPLDYIVRNIWHELREAFSGRYPEVARAAAGLPYRVALRAVDQNAEAIVRRMLDLYVQVYPEANQAPDPAVRRTVRRACVDIPLEFMRLKLALAIESKSTSDTKRSQLVNLLDVAQTKIAELARAVMEEDPEDVKTLAAINDGWNELFRSWNPEYEAPMSWEIEHAQRTLGPDHPTTRELEQRAAKSEELVKIKEAALLKRDALRFGLAWWAFRRLRARQDGAWAKAFTEFRQYFGSAEHLTRAMNAAVGDDVEAEPFFSWLLQDTVGNAVGAIDWSMFQAYVVMAAYVVDPTLREPQIEKPRHFTRSEGRRLWEEVAHDAPLWGLLDPPADGLRRLVKVWRMVSRA